MRKEIVLPPEWELVPLSCPKCHKTLRAQFAGPSKSLEALKCTSCDWFLDAVQQKRVRRVRLQALARKFPSTKTRQTIITRDGGPGHEH